MSDAVLLCDNCGEPAVYQVRDPGALPALYCYTGLPDHLRERAALGHFDLVVEQWFEPEPRKRRKKAVDPLVEEEPVVPAEPEE